MIKNIANAGGILIVSFAIWLVCKMALNMTVAEALICALALSGIITVLAFFHWRPQPGGRLEDVELFGLIAKFVGGEIFASVFLLVDAVFAHVNLLDRSQWPKLWNAGGIFGFGLTAGLGALFSLFLLLFLATLVRLLILKAAKKCGKQEPHAGPSPSASNQ